MKGIIGIIFIVFILIGPVFGFGDTKDKPISLIDAETFMMELHDPDPAVKIQAIIGLGLLKFQPAVPELVDALKDQTTSMWASESLAIIGSKKAVPGLIVSLTDSPNMIYAARALRAIGDPSGLAAIEEFKKKVDGCGRPYLCEEDINPINTMIEDKKSIKPFALMSPVEKEQKLKETWKQYKNEKVLEKKGEYLVEIARLSDIRIFNELEKCDESVLWEVFDSLPFFHSAEAVKALISALDRFPSVKEYFSQKSFTFNDPALADALLPLLSSTDKVEFQLAADSLSEMGEQRAIKILRSRLLDNDEDIQEIAEYAIEEFGPSTINEYEDNENPQSFDDLKDARSWLKQELAKEGHPEADVLIAKALDDKELPIDRKVIAIEMAGEKGFHSAVPHLAKLLTGPSIRLCEATAMALAKIGDTLSIHTLLRALLSENFWTREFASEALLSLEKSTMKIDSLAQQQGEKVVSQWQERKKWHLKATKMMIEPTNTPVPVGQSGKFASLAVITENGVLNYRFKQEINAYEATAIKIAAGVRHVVASSDCIAIATVNRLFILNRHLNKQAELMISGIKAIAFAGNTLLATAGGHLLTFSKDLQLIGKIGLAIPTYESEWKDAHDILIKGKRAYLLDNIVQPVFVLQVDINQPFAPKLLSKQWVGKVQPHLTMQFLSNEDDTWNIVLDNYDSGYDRIKKRSLLQYSMKDGQPIRLFDCPAIPTVEDVPEIISITSEIPGWAIAAYGEHLALVRINKPAHFVNSVPALYLEKEIKLDDDNCNYSNWPVMCSSTPQIYQYGDLLYISFDNQLWVVRAGEKPKIILHQVLDKPILKMAVIPEQAN